MARVLAAALCTLQGTYLPTTEKRIRVAVMADSAHSPHTNGVSAGRSKSIVLVTALMLFSMFFGAGNLIFPPILGAQAGSNLTPAILGFLGTGVVLPVLAIIAIAISGQDVSDLARRGGKIFGFLFPILAYLSIGAFYALPRTGAVSFSTAIQPLFGWDSTLASVIFNFLFFAIALALAYNPQSIVDKLGKYLTPALLILLAVLVSLVLINFTPENLAPAENFQHAPFAGGLLQGYLTMDSIAALAFGIVVISSLKTLHAESLGHTPVAEDRAHARWLVRSTIVAGVIAGVLLGIIYVGLGLVGRFIPNPGQYEDGAGILSAAAGLTMGTTGQVIFGLIVLLACMTTAVGLIAATSEFFSTLWPAVPYRTWAILFAIMSFGLASAGLDTVLAVAAPVIGFLYPAAITLVFLTLIEPLLGGKIRFRVAFRFAITVAVIWSLLMTFASLGWGAEAINQVIGWSPLHKLDLGWVLPTVIAWLLGLVVDIVRQRDTASRVVHEAPAQ